MDLDQKIEAQEWAKVAKLAGIDVTILKEIISSYLKDNGVYRLKVNDKNVLKFYQDYKENYKNDTGLDLVMSERVTVPAKAIGFKIDLGVSCLPPEGSTSGYMLLPRSSLSNTPLRLSNSVGIFDPGYTGPVIAAVDNLSDKEYTVELRTKDQPTRLFQLCRPGLSPFRFKLVDDLPKTDRGAGGFGSSNIKK